MGEHKLNIARPRRPHTVNGKDYQGLRFRPFLVIESVQRPAPGVNTSAAGWTKDPKNWTVFERPYVLDRVTAKAMRDATVIIDVTHSALVKCRFEDVKDDEVLGHYLDQYRDQVKEAVSIWLSRMAARMQADPTFALPYSAEATEPTAETTETAAAE